AHPRALHSFPTRRSSDLAHCESSGARIERGLEALEELRRHGDGNCRGPLAPNALHPDGTDQSADRIRGEAIAREPRAKARPLALDRKSTRLNSSHRTISY